MMKMLVTILMVLVMDFRLSVSAKAEMIDMGDGTLYDTDLKLTWLKDAGMGGLMTWSDAMTWADNLVYAGFDNWRLPNAMNQDGSSPCLGYNCIGSEMGHLYHKELGNPIGGLLSNSGDFIDLNPLFYWSGTESGNGAWGFNFGNGHQHEHKKWHYRYVLPVRPGERSRVP
ncbi:MAG: DUF1566 domain-containing protein [Nitrospinae bacterium]|nr:DUF1566 domain-containing protein [Nitrospinota bacterium]